MLCRLQSLIILQGIINVVVSKDGTIVPGTRIAKVDENGEKYTLEMVPATENRCCLLANLFSSRGNVCKVSLGDPKKRTNLRSFVSILGCKSSL